MVPFRVKFTAMAIGNMMEWYDFAIYGALADVIGKELFPSSDRENGQLLKSLAVFGAAFLARPLGGIVIGWIGDTFGRKRALEISIALMLFPSFLIGCLPPYRMMGISTTILLIVIRLLQGCAVGGELVGAYVYTIENTGGNHRGFWGACCKASGNLGTTLGMGFAALLRYNLSKEEFLSWGWRIPFWIGILFGTIGIWLRSLLGPEDVPTQVDVEDDNVKETLGDGERINPMVDCSAGKNQQASASQAEKDIEEAQELVGSTVEEVRSDDKVTGAPTSTKMSRECSRKKNPLIEVLRTNWREVLCVALTSAFWGCSYYSSFVWMSYFMSSSSLVGGDGVPGSWYITFCMSALLVVMFPFGGLLGDIIGNKIKDEDKGFRLVMQAGIIIMLFTAVPAFALISTRTTGGAVLGQFCLLVAVILFGSNLPAFMISQFEYETRYSGVGIAYNISQALFSGTAPMIQTALVLSHSVYSGQKESNHWDVGRPRLDGYHLHNDGRLRPAYYMMAVGAMSLAVLSIAVPLCEERRKHEKAQIEHEQAPLKADYALTLSSNNIKE